MNLDWLDPDSNVSAMAGKNDLPDIPMPRLENDPLFAELMRLAEQHGCQVAIVVGKTSQVNLTL